MSGLLKVKACRIFTWEGFTQSRKENLAPLVFKLSVFA